MTSAWSASSPRVRSIQHSGARTGAVENLTDVQPDRSRIATNARQVFRGHEPDAWWDLIGRGIPSAAWKKRRRTAGCAA